MSLGTAAIVESRDGEFDLQGNPGVRSGEGHMY